MSQFRSLLWLFVNRVTDTCEWNDGPDTWAAPGNETLIGPGNSTYGVCGQALVLFIAK